MTMACAINQLVPDNAEPEIECVLSPESAVIRQKRQELIEFIDPMHMIPCLTCLTHMDEEEIEAKKNQEGRMRGCLLFLDKIVRRKNFWNDLLKGLNHSSVRLTHVAEMLVKDGISEQSADVDERLQVYDKDMNVVMSEMKLREIYTKHIELTEKCPREYQKVLALPAIQGRNTIMCAPTGCGKTMAASLVCKAHLEKGIPVTKSVKNPSGEGIRLEEQPVSVPNPKILFLVPRNAILQHVYEELTGYLALWDVGQRRGNSPKKMPLHKMLKLCDVVVATADMFKNALLREQTMKINDATLIIFDECHHTTLEHTYNQIMSQYLQFKHADPGAKLPQIVGLSASPGAGKTPSENSAVQFILKLCANLDAEVFQTIPEKLQEELRCHVPTPKKAILATGTREQDPFTDKIVHAMAQLEASITMKKGGEKAGSPEYQSLVSVVKQSAEEKLDDKTRRFAQHLLCYNEALLMVKTARFVDGFNILQEFYQKVKSRTTTDAHDKFLLSVFTGIEDDLKNLLMMEKKYPNPKLTRLQESLVSHQLDCQQKEQEFRAITFVKTKAHALALKNWMDADDKLSLLGSEILLGSGGMTEAQQNATLDRFARGEFKLLNSTSVGEEGLNVTACNLVIRYDDVKNEISMVQSRGRARAREAQETVIGESGTIEKHQYNLLMEDIMNTGIQRVQDLPERQFKQEIQHYQDIHLADQKHKKREKELLQNQNEDSDIQLKCKGSCGEIVCKASDIRVVNNSQYINPDPAFTEKITLKPHDKEDYKRRGIQKVHCRACDHDWGNTCGGGQPTLALKSFLVVIDGHGKSVKQWSKIPCKIQTLAQKA